MLQCLPPAWLATALASPLWALVFENVHTQALWVSQGLMLPASLPIVSDMYVGVRGSPERDILFLGAMGLGPGRFPALFA